MGITLQQLYEQTRDKFQLKLLAGGKAMTNEVTRLYYMEDIMISDWTRRGELIVTTAMSVQKEENWLRRFIDSLYPFEPSGIIVNLGGYIDEIPQEIIDYCNEINLPFLTFPWEMFLQDLQQDFMNRIYEAEQFESNVVNAFLNAIYAPDNKSEYVKCLEKNGYGRYEMFCVAQVSWEDAQAAKEFMRRIQEGFKRIVVIPREKETIIVFCGVIMKQIIIALESTTEVINNRFGPKTLWIGVGNMVANYDEVYESYQRACDCSHFGRKNSRLLVSFEQLGLEGLLMTCDRAQMRQYVGKKLDALQQYDQENQSDYMVTLEAFVKHGGNAVEVAKELYIHRNTVNYRLKRIKEMLGADFSGIQDFVEYQMAFYIRDIL